ncbi:putative permease [Escherichia coli]|uniref:Putative permease n=1 Tax=Escherichia coli TaxID=562 RepID=A0A376MLU7_ECOLX|nr:putative permease [Escherichia coli]
MIGDLSSHGVLLGILGFFIINRVVHHVIFMPAVLVSIGGDVLLWLIFRVMFILAVSIPFRLILAGVIGEVD